MSNRKMVLVNLLRNSIEAYFAAIEIHNKPNINYRYETVSLLLINAWELLLKAFVRKNIKNRKIFKADGHTISLKEAVNFTDEYINVNFQKHDFKATKENLSLLEQYRNENAHFYNETIEPIIFTLIAKNALDYVEFVKKHFKKDVLAREGLFVLPLGFKLPFKPEDYLSSKSANYKYSLETKRFIDSVVNIVHNLKNEGIEESVVLGFNIYLESVKKCKNSDIIAAITSSEEASIGIVQYKKVRLTNDLDAVKVQLSYEQILERYPLEHGNVIYECDGRYSDFKVNSKFHSIIRKVKNDINLAYPYRLNPLREKPVKYFYSYDVLNELDNYYTRK